MTWDSITRVGARSPGVKRRVSLEWRCSTEQAASTQCGGSVLPRRARRTETNLGHAMGMLGASLTAACSGKVPSDKPALQPYWGKPAVRLIGGIEERSSRQGRSLAGCKSPHRQLPVFGRLAYPMRGEATNRVLLGRKSPGCPAGVFAAVGTIWGASKLGGRNITKYLQPRKSPLARSRFKRDNCGKPTHFPLGKADDTVEETGESTRCTAGVGDPASKNRLLEITSGSVRLNSGKGEEM